MTDAFKKDKNTQTPPPPNQDTIKQLIRDFLSHVTIDCESFCTDLIPYLPDKRFDISGYLTSPSKKQSTAGVRDIPPSGLHHRIPRCDIDFQIWCANRDLAEINDLLNKTPFNELKNRYGTGGILEDMDLRDEPFINIIEAINKEKIP